MTNRYLIYQFGNLPPFSRVNIKQNTSKSFKTLLDNNVLGDGSVRSNGTNPDKLADQTVPFSFELTGNDNLDKYRKVFNSGVQKVFFIKELTNGTPTPTVQILWNYGTITKYDLDDYQVKESLGQDIKVYNAELRLITPYLYSVEDDDLVFYDYSGGTTINYDTGRTWDSGFLFDQFEISSTRYFKDYTVPQEYDLFGYSNIKNTTPTVKLVLTDRYFKQETSTKQFNQFLWSEDITQSVWVKTDCTASVTNINRSVVGKNVMTITVGGSPTNASISQANISTVVSQLQFRVAIKAGSGNATHIRLEQNNSTDGTASSGLIAITSGTSLGNGWYEHLFTRTPTVTTSNTSATIRFRTSGDAQPTAASTILIAKPMFWTTTIYGSNLTYCPTFEYNITKYVNPQNGLVITLATNSTQTFTTEGLNLATTIESKTNILHIGQMNFNEMITIENKSNNTSLIFTWTSATISPTSMRIYTHTRKVYDNATGLAVPIGSYTLTPITGRAMFKLRNLSVVDSQTDTQSFDILNITKNTAGNLPLMIKNLTTFI